MPSLSNAAEQQTTVLVLEDEEGLAELYSAWLSDEYSVRTAYSATEAREKLDEDVDVALIDRRLPEGSGDEILDSLSQNHPRCRRAMVTAVNPDTDIVEMPLDDYLIKPIDRDELIETVRRLAKLPNGDGTVRELYAVTRKRAQLASELSEAERLDSEEFAWLESEAEKLEQVATDTHGQFDDGDLLGLRRGFKNGFGGDL
jgi:DNA-binding NtrC family response regulator